ncbi:MAG: phosphatidylserine decarboxylase family protein [Bacteroidetes bacterium]|nr:phosphatidylserine decarboxylase family protein [Bacteroidota bacterium]
MKFHREGRLTITVTILFVAIMNIGMYLIFPSFGIWNALIVALSIFLLYIILQFFRNPPRNTTSNPENIIAPADGKVVVIEEVEEPEYFHGKRIQVSIFMSPMNVHVNRYPIGGNVTYVKYHPGLYLVAWHPKSSTDNERTTVVVKDEKGREILFRQVAGALARRIVHYSKVGDTATQGGEMGFIKFGSRVDVYLPLGTKINVPLNAVVRGGETAIATF